jgi:hypothetical protein
MRGRVSLTPRHRHSSASDYYDPSLSVLFLLLQSQEDSLARLPRKICTAILPGSSSASPSEDIIEEVIVVLDQERDSFSTLESMSEACIARHELAVGLMARMKALVKTWRRAAS